MVGVNDDADATGPARDLRSVALHAVGWSVAMHARLLV